MKNYQVHLDKVVTTTRKLLKEEPKIIFEMGANDCSDTIAFSNIFPTAHVYAFECNPTTLPICKNKIRDKKNITLTEKAVTEKEGSIKFFKTVGNGTSDGNINHGASSIFEANKDIGKYNQEQIVVQATTIKRVCVDNNINQIDLLWMDMQGSELNALKGAGDFIKNIKVINTEVEFFFEYKDQPLFKDVKKYLNKNGFRLYTFSTMGKIAGDAVFINTNIIKKSFLPPEWMIIVYFRLYEKITGKFRKLRNQIPKKG